jgi:hypothetical protein
MADLVHDDPYGVGSTCQHPQRELLSPEYHEERLPYRAYDETYQEFYAGFIVMTAINLIIV